MAIASYTKICSKNVAGNSSKLYITEVANIASVTVTSGEISAFTMVTGTTFKEVECDQDSIKRMQEGTGTQNNITYVHAVEGRLAKPDKTINTLMDAIADGSACGMIAVIKDNNGTYWCVGYNEVDELERALYLAQDTTDSGESPEDDGVSNNFMRLECKSGYRDIPLISGGVITSVI